MDNSEVDNAEYKNTWGDEVTTYIMTDKGRKHITTLYTLLHTLKLNESSIYN